VVNVTSTASRPSKDSPATSGGVVLVGVVAAAALGLRRRS
jgi:MYXO-CTERM domain-containing protein